MLIRCVRPRSISAWQAVDQNLTMYGKILKSFFAKKTPYWK